MKVTKKDKKKGQIAPIGATEIDISLISEDIYQPRKEFNQETLRELTETIKLRGGEIADIGTPRYGQTGNLYY